MNRPIDQHAVLTLAEAARFLRLKPAKVRALAEAGQVPGQQYDGEWRFLKAALEEHLRGKRDSADIFLSQAGAFEDDDTLEDLLREIYKKRGRPMVEGKQ